MLLYDRRQIGNMLLARRRRLGLTQEEVAEAAELSGRAYADIERGSANMRIETALRICDALGVTPDDFLTQPDPDDEPELDDVIERLKCCPARERKTALQLLDVYLRSVERLLSGAARCIQKRPGGAFFACVFSGGSVE